MWPARARDLRGIRWCLRLGPCPCTRGGPRRSAVVRRAPSSAGNDPGSRRDRGIGTVAGARRQPGPGRSRTHRSTPAATAGRCGGPLPTTPPSRRVLRRLPSGRARRGGRRGGAAPEGAHRADARHHLRRALVPGDRPARLPAPARQRGRRKPVGVLPGLPGGGQGSGRDHPAEPAHGGGRGGLRVRAHRRGGHLARRARGVRGAAGRPGGAARGVLPHGLRPVPRLHGGSVPDGRGGVPVRVVTPLLVDRRTLRMRRRPQPGCGHRRHRGAGAGRDPGGMARALLASRRRHGGGAARARRVHGLRLVRGGDARGLPHLRSASGTANTSSGSSPPPCPSLGRCARGRPGRPSCPTRWPVRHSSWGSSGSGGSIR